jgi:hypothetical protein
MTELVEALIYAAATEVIVRSSHFYRDGICRAALAVVLRADKDLAHASTGSVVALRLMHEEQMSRGQVKRGGS